MKLSKTKVKRARPILGTYVEIDLEGPASEPALHEAITAGFEEILRIDQLMSFHRPESDLSRLNRARPLGWVQVHPDTLLVLKTSTHLYQASGGAFDIRCGLAPAVKSGNPSSQLNRIPLEFDSIFCSNLPP